MNTSQLKYARERAGALLRQRRTAVQTEYAAKKVELTGAQRLKALQAGEFTVTRAPPDYAWYNGIKFDAETDHKAIDKARDAALSALETAYTRLIDELVLGDNEEALRLLKEFERGTE